MLNGVEDIVKPDNEDLGLDVHYNASSLEKKLEIKASYQEAQVRRSSSTPPPPLPYCPYRAQPTCQTARLAAPRD